MLLNARLMPPCAGRLDEHEDRDSECEVEPGGAGVGDDDADRHDAERDDHALRLQARSRGAVTSSSRMIAAGTRNAA